MPRIDFSNLVLSCLIVCHLLCSYIICIQEHVSDLSPRSNWTILLIELELAQTRMLCRVPWQIRPAAKCLREPPGSAWKSFLNWKWCFIFVPWIVKTRVLWILGELDWMWWVWSSKARWENWNSWAVIRARVVVGWLVRLYRFFLLIFFKFRKVDLSSISEATQLVYTIYNIREISLGQTRCGPQWVRGIC